MNLPTSLPEPLTITDTLFSLKGIRQIFEDQKGFYQKFEPIIISCPFAMLDSYGFKKDVDKFMAIENQGKFKELKVIHKWAEGNIKFYEQHIRDKVFDNPEPLEKYYIFDNDDVYGTGFSSANGFLVAEEFVRNPDNQQAKSYPTLYWFYEFCKEVHKVTGDLLTEPVEPGNPTAQVNTEPQPKPKRVKKDTHPPLSFIDYLYTDDNQKSLEYLKGQFAGRKGKTIAYMIFALKSKHLLKKHDLMSLYKAITADFGYIGSYVSINKQRIPDKEINPKKYKEYCNIQLIVVSKIDKPTQY